MLSLIHIFLEDFWELEKEFPNFHFHLSLDRKDPVADAQGVKYYEGFAVNCLSLIHILSHNFSLFLHQYLNVLTNIEDS